VRCTSDVCFGPIADIERTMMVQEAGPRRAAKSLSYPRIRPAACRPRLSRHVDDDVVTDREAKAGAFSGRLSREKSRRADAPRCTALSKFHDVRSYANPTFHAMARSISANRLEGRMNAVGSVSLRLGRPRRTRPLCARDCIKLTRSCFSRIITVQSSYSHGVKSGELQ
jgi:hypothetical protein